MRSISPMLDKIILDQATKPPILKEACRNEAASSLMLDEAVRPSFLDKAIHHEGP